MIIGAFLHRAVAKSRKRSLQALPQPERARDVSTTAVAVIDPFNFSLPHRREVFTGVLTAGREYDITITGVVRGCLFVRDRFVNADAFYYEDHHGNFTKAHNSLSIDSRSVAHACLIDPDRELHHYTLCYNGDGKKLAFCFDARPTEDQYKQGSLYVSIRETTASNDAEAQERAKESKAEAERQASIQRLIQKLETFKEYEPHLADPAHQEKYAHRHKDDLLNNRDAIRQKHLHFRTHLLPCLKEQGREDLIPFGEWEARAFAIAERLDVEPPPAPAPRRKLTNEELKADTERYRQRKRIWDQAKREDVRQNVEDFLHNDRYNWQLEQEYVAELRGRGLDEDDIQQRLPEFRAALSQPEDGGNGQGFKRL